MVAKTENIRIDPEFSGLIPPLSFDELSALRESLLKDGCRDNLVVWNGILLDGYARKSLCDELCIPYNIINIELKDRDEAKIWIVKNQLSRRNITTYHRVRMALLLKPSLKAMGKKRMSSGGKLSRGGSVTGKSLDGNAHNSLEVMSKLSKTSIQTVQKCDWLEKNADAETRKRLASGETTIKQEYRRLKEIMSDYDILRLKSERYEKALKLISNYDLGSDLPGKVIDKLQNIAKTALSSR